MRTINVESGDDTMQNDALNFVNEYGKSEDLVQLSAPLKTSTKDLLKTVGAITQAFAMWHRSADLLDSLSADDVVQFTDGQPDSEKCKDAIHFHHLYVNLLPDVNQSGASSSMTPESQEAFASLRTKWTNKSVEVLWACHDIIVDSYGKSYEKPSLGWVVSDELEKLLVRMRDSLMKLKCFTVSGAESKEQSSKEVERLEGSIKEISAMLDVQLTGAEIALKEELSNQLASLQAVMPSKSLEETMCKPLEFFQEHLPKATVVSAPAGEFFKVLEQCKPVDRLGETISEEANKMALHAKVFLASLSACGIVKSDDPGKAAVFEENKLKTRHLTLDQLPSSVSGPLIALSKK